MKAKYNYYKQSCTTNQLKTGNGSNIPLIPSSHQRGIPLPQYFKGFHRGEQPFQPQIYINKPKNLSAINGESKRNNMWGMFGEVHYAFPEVFYSQGVKNKPISLYENKRPKEKLLKGQNQLILEKLQAKYSLLVNEKNEGMMPRTGVNFYKKKKRIFPSGASRQRFLSSKGKNQATQSKTSNMSVNTVTSGFFNGDVKDNAAEENKKEGDVIFNKLNHNDFVERSKRPEIERIPIRSKESLNMNVANRNSRKSLTEKEQPLTNRETRNRQELDDIQVDAIGNKSKIEINHKGIDLNEVIKPLNAKRDEEIPQGKEDTERNAPSHDISNNKSTSHIKKETINEAEDNEENNNEKQEKKRASSSYFNMSNINVAKIINQVFENNRKAAAAQSRDFFQEIGKEYQNNHMRKTQPNFFNSNSKYTEKPPEMPKTLNSLELKLSSPIEWRKHEEIWANISSLTTLSSDLEKHLIPPNESDVLISSYIKLFPNVLNFCSIGNICSLSQTQTSCLSLSINDKMQNPKLEMKKWKDAYKRVVLRWHPDKLFAMLNEMKLKDESKRLVLKKKSTLIINNLNALFKQIMEILKKIAHAKDTNDKTDDC